MKRDTLGWASSRVYWFRLFGEGLHHQHHLLAFFVFPTWVSCFGFMSGLWSRGSCGSPPHSVASVSEPDWTSSRCLNKQSITNKSYILNTKPTQIGAFLFSQLLKHTPFLFFVAFLESANDCHQLRFGVLVSRIPAPSSGRRPWRPWWLWRPRTKSCWCWRRRCRSGGLVGGLGLAKKEKS